MTESRCNTIYNGTTFIGFLECGSRFTLRLNTAKSTIYEGRSTITCTASRSCDRTTLEAWYFGYTMWNMLVKIPECFVHLDASYMYQSMDLTNDKPSHCEMHAILKFFTPKVRVHRIHHPYSPGLAPVTIICFQHWKTTSSHRKLKMQHFRCSRTWIYRSTVSE